MVVLVLRMADIRKDLVVNAEDMMANLEDAEASINKERSNFDSIPGSFLLIMFG